VVDTTDNKGRFVVALEEVSFIDKEKFLDNVK
jgi:hypothetical protein